MKMENTFWIWYPGDFELYHAMKQNFSRVERGFGWPAFWKSEGFRNRVAFRRTYELEQETSFTVFSNAIGHVLVTRENGEKKYPFGKKITVAPGKVRISIHAGCVEAFPCAENEKCLSLCTEVILLEGKAKERGLAAFQEAGYEINRYCNFIHLQKPPCIFLN